MTETKDDFSKSPSRVGKSLENHLLDTNPFLANALNLYPLKTQENQRFSRVFRGVWNESADQKWVTFITCFSNEKKKTLQDLIVNNKLRKLKKNNTLNHLRKLTLCLLSKKANLSFWSILHLTSSLWWLLDKTNRKSQQISKIAVHAQPHSIKNVSFRFIISLGNNCLHKM